MAALQWLQKNNPFYTDLQIDFDALRCYPAGDDFVEGLSTVTVDTGE